MKKTQPTIAVVLSSSFQGLNSRIIGIVELLIYKSTSEVLKDPSDVKRVSMGNHCVLTSKLPEPMFSWTMTFCHCTGFTEQHN